MLTTNPQGDTHWYGNEDNVRTCSIDDDTSIINFNLKSDHKTLESSCQEHQADDSNCTTSFNHRYNLSPETHDSNRRRITSCSLQRNWWWSLPGCGELNECVLPQGDKNSSDNYAKLGTRGGVQLSVAPCYTNNLQKDSGIWGRIKNPDTMDGSYQAWSSAENVCNAEGIDPYNEKCKHYDHLISCERRGWKEDCEKTEPGCSMYEGGSCCTWDDKLSMCTKNTQHCNRHTSLTECNADPSKMCRWGPDEMNSDDYRAPGCYPNKGFQDSYLNTMDNTCRSPQFYDKNKMWQRTGSQDSDGFEKCQMVKPPENPENPNQYFATKEECEGKTKITPPPRFACVSIDQDDNLIEGNTCTQLPETMHWDGATYSSKEACEVGTNYCTTIKDCRVLCTDEQCEKDHCPQSHMFPYLCTTGPEKSGCNSHVHGWEESSQCHGCCDSSVCI